MNQHCHGHNAQVLQICSPSPVSGVLRQLLDQKWILLQQMPGQELSSQGQRQPWVFPRGWAQGLVWWCPWLGRAVDSWRPALLRHGWGRGWQPWGLTWGAGLWGAPGGWQGQSGLGPVTRGFLLNFCSQRLFSHLDMVVFCSLSLSIPWLCLAVRTHCGSHLLTGGTKAAISLRHTCLAALLHNSPALPLERLVPQWGGALHHACLQLQP